MKKRRILLAGMPNVGKSTVFNALTGENQHTGNWIGKTVETAKGEFDYHDHKYEIVDLPGTYSLNTHSKEEEVARDAICFQNYDLLVVVVDAVSLERNLSLVLQILEITPKVVLCVNLIDEAEKKKITIDEKTLSKKLGIEVVKTSARKKIGLEELLEKVEKTCEEPKKNVTKIRYSKKMEEGIQILEKYLEKESITLPKRFMSIKLLTEEGFIKKIEKELKWTFQKTKEITNLIRMILEDMEKDTNLLDEISEATAKKQSQLVENVITMDIDPTEERQRKIDKILTSKLTGIPIMIVLLMIVFFITITLSNYPSDLLFELFSKIEDVLLNLFAFLKIPNWITSALVLGIYKTLSWVVAVMLPPMTIFFPMFSLLEDLGFLPRVAFNMDGIFQKCNACGKQSLTMMMGFGCNAVGVTGSRIIDSRRERLIAILTNNFVPCNGRFPMLIAMISMFFVGPHLKSITQVLILTGFIGLACMMTFLISYILSKTLLKGEKTSFTLELPPFRKPDIGKVIIRSLKDKTFHVLKRAVIVSIPAGLFIWILANIQVSGLSLLAHFANILDPFAKGIGLDGVILAAFILGFPANEIVIPIMIMAYLMTGTMQEYTSLVELRNLFVNNGWTYITALCTCLFSIFHFPCSTTLLTIYHETKSKRWTFLSFILPTLLGIILCFLAKNLCSL